MDAILGLISFCCIEIFLFSFWCPKDVFQERTLHRENISRMEFLDQERKWTDFIGIFFIFIFVCYVCFYGFPKPAGAIQREPLGIGRDSTHIFWIWAI